MFKSSRVFHLERSLIRSFRRARLRRRTRRKIASGHYAEFGTREARTEIAGAQFHLYAVFLTHHGHLDQDPCVSLSRGMAMRDLITEKLTAAFTPESLSVVAESHQHEGHAGHQAGGESHFRIYIVSDAFRGKSRIERHRMINATLAAELAGRIHALAIHATSPDERS